MRDSGDALIATLDVGPGMDVLDLGCGDGTTALPSARRGARVLGVDIASNLVAAGIRRAREAGLDNLHFQQGDASSLDDLSDRSEEHTSELQSLMRKPYAVFCLKKNNDQQDRVKTIKSTK